MLILIAAAAAVSISSADQFHAPQSERYLYEANCHGRVIQVEDANGKLSVTAANGPGKKDLSATTFYQSYLAGSYVGRFVLACGSDQKHIAYGFLGYEVGKKGEARTVEGLLQLGAELQVVSDAAIAPAQLSLVDFNKRRLDILRARQ